MIEFISTKLAKLTTHESKYNYLREYLQYIILKKLEELGCYKNIAFVGGTALRILFQLKRFSEDLDFSVVDAEGFKFSAIVSGLEKSLLLENLPSTIRFKETKTVASAFIKFTDILYQLDLSLHKDQVLMVKFEVDQNPPLGYDTEFTMVANDFIIGVNHYDLPSLFSGKLHAVLFRKYTKGRDIYDLLWYLSHQVKPNYLLLNNAIAQTEGKSYSLDEDSLREHLLAKVENLDLKKVSKDVLPFLENRYEAEYFNPSLLKKTIAKAKL